MKYFYTYQQNAFEPIAHERVLVHVHYERISSFLSQIFGLEFSTILAKPIVKGNQVNWSNSYKAELIRISELDEEKRANVLEKYWQFREAVDLKIEEFDGTDQTEKKEWSAILKKVFDENNNVLFSDEKGELLSIVWGGKFNNNKENPKSEKYIAFENRNTTPPMVIPTSEIINTEDEVPEPVAEENIEEIEFVANHKNTSSKNRRTKKYTFWQVCDRSITWFCFRYWWIALLTFIIVLLLLLFCWWGYFDKHRVCISNDEINQRIIDIENNLEFCCDCIEEEEIEIEEEEEEAILRDSVHFPADYLVITYQFSSEGGKDLDTRTQIISPSESERLGCGFPENNGDDALTWSGDNTGYGVESCWVDLTKFAGNETVKIDCKSFWYSQRNSGNMSLDVRAFKGGTMNKTGYQFYNTGGTETGFISYSKNIQLYRGACTITGEKLGLIIYNKQTEELSFNER